MISCTGPDHVALAELEGGSKNMMNGSYVPSVSSNTSGCFRLSSSSSISALNVIAYCFDSAHRKRCR